MTYDASDEAHIAKARKAEEDRDRDLDYVMREPRGRRLMYELIYGTCHVERLSHVPGDADSTAFNEGARAIGQHLLDRIRLRSQTQFMLMLKENHFEEESDG